MKSSVPAYMVPVRISSKKLSQKKIISAGIELLKASSRILIKKTPFNMILKKRAKNQSYIFNPIMKNTNFSYSKLRDVKY